MAYGSADGIVDKAEAAANWSEAGYVAAYFDMKGFDFASELFDFYIGNNGPDARYTMTADQVRKVLKTGDVRDKARVGLDRIKDIVKADPRIGSREVTTDWILTYPTDDSDIANALGHFSIAVGSDVKVEQKDGDSRLLAHIDCVVYIYDYYNFDQARQFDTDLIYSLKTNIDADMRQLEAAGWARSFRVSGNTRNIVPMSWEGYL
ncbi:hypothetical protein [Nocardia arthritidis]|uniref:Uncharacterized protein n=1 Tax=Nocardia arthritidis TaxID=228602 RepID=A0A6G9YNW9_9NOCA|nr:hypothetical protein [Nocardia arthritidis]QIS14623.1 hypothetical protein F5544_33940 [Nocardia arthritidis]